jgi:hypothetical protein
MIPGEDIADLIPAATDVISRQPDHRSVCFCRNTSSFGYAELRQLTQEEKTSK